MSLESGLTAAAIIMTGVVAGLFVGWSVSVIPGTRRVGDATYIATMQQINRSIINPLFIVLFIGTPVVLLGAAESHRRAGDSRAAVWLFGAAATYVIGMLGVTGARNVPLNNALAAFQLDGAAADEISRRRESYEESWNRWHTIRTIAVTFTFGCVALAAAAPTE